MSQYSNRNNSMEKMIPSADFASYAQDLIDEEIRQPLRCPDDVMEARLWAAAQFDCYMQGRTVRRLLDGLGLPVSEASGYQQVIKPAVSRYRQFLKS
jgi:hypothetical protein